MFGGMTSSNIEDIKLLTVLISHVDLPWPIIASTTLMRGLLSLELVKLNMFGPVILILINRFIKLKTAKI